ncbi:MAG: substrate-binding domain-containing protein, partial [Micrococcales bacterium]|nr:substrate-binding domain-containing protein [Micrococcales bacterium]
LLDTGVRGEAIITFNDRLAFGAYQAIQEAGLSIPGDFSIVSFDDHQLASWLRPRLTTFALPHYELGALAGSSPSSARASRMPRNRSDPATVCTGTSSGPGPAPTRWMRECPAARSTSTAARPAEYSSGTMEGTAPTALSSGRAFSSTTLRGSIPAGTARTRVNIDAMMRPSTWRSIMPCTRRRSSSGAPSVSPMKSMYPFRWACSRAPLMRSPASCEVATVSETKPIVRLDPRRNADERMLGR